MAYKVEIKLKENEMVEHRGDRDKSIYFVNTKHYQGELRKGEVIQCCTTKEKGVLTWVNYGCSSRLSAVFRKGTINISTYAFKPYEEPLFELGEIALIKCKKLTDTSLTRSITWADASKSCFTTFYSPVEVVSDRFLGDSYVVLKMNGTPEVTVGNALYKYGSKAAEMLHKGTAVLVRGGKGEKWLRRVYSKQDGDTYKPYRTVDGQYWGMCLPYSLFKHLEDTHQTPFLKRGADEEQGDF